MGLRRLQCYRLQSQTGRQVSKSNSLMSQPAIGCRYITFLRRHKINRNQAITKPFKGFSSKWQLFHFRETVTNRGFELMTIGFVFPPLYLFNAVNVLEQTKTERCQKAWTTLNKKMDGKSEEKIEKEKKTGNVVTDRTRSLGQIILVPTICIQ